ncbi:type I-MYXAN CRISPR-associated protein Cas6/Cmx6 [Coleofasciculus sp. FACHB-SPT36]|uniref:type I-MYXAN CRISPR-associated protein Cas6/Cmx6 n=1 Tax=Cyanophyceae TaxID=3028117 RepID=UPI00168B4D34|nr:type I-MYXAN CRISPR-associated protein Cas6/Cmx6 [Coleofasciculus sp. FACHB-SPT36]MBD2538640.1 type I-MYXAN CRISPR-associated protein Cas6/Cmx6 [Coleofasciculus sp. FACHB-SPT36]
MTANFINSEEYLDLTFKLRGSPIPLDNGYPIYSALSRICPPLHELDSIGIHPIAGIPTSNNFLELTAQSRLKIRIHHQQIPLIYPYLAGQAFQLGQHFYQLDIPDYKPLISSESVYSRLVLIKGFQDPTNFIEAVQRQLDSLGIQGKIELLTRQDGTPQRRQLTINKEEKQFKVRGFGVKISELNSEDSLTLQEQGIGGKRKMMCGIFVPATRSKEEEET